MDLSKLSNQDLIALRDGNLAKISTAGLQAMARPAAPAPVDPTEGQSFGRNMLQGIGKGFVDLGRGAGQMLGMVSQQEVADSRALDASLMNRGGGVAGNIVGNVAAALPAMFVPGANTVAGAGLIGAASGALQPTVAGESRIENAALGGALGAGAQYGAGRIAQGVADNFGRKVIQGAQDAKVNAVRDSILSRAQQAGYVVPPSQAGGGMGMRALEGLSGKAKTEQLASIRNQEVTNRLAKQALGLTEDVPLTAETLDVIRQKAGESYAAVQALPAINWDKQFISSVKGLKVRGGATKSPAVADIDEMIWELTSQNKWRGDQLVFDIKNLREKARANITSAARAGGDVEKEALGKAQQKAADMLEGLAERNLMHNGANPRTIDDLKAARTLIAKTYTVQNALEGGNVKAADFARLIKKGKPISAELEAIGEFAQSFGKSAQVPQSGFNNPVTVLDMFGTGAAGMGMGPAALAWPAARVGARYGVLSKGAQRAMGNQYGPGLTDEMLLSLTNNRAAKNLGLFAPSVYAGQE